MAALFFRYFCFAVIFVLACPYIFNKSVREDDF